VDAQITTLLIRAKSPYHGDGDRMRNGHMVVKQHGIGADILREFIEHRRQQHVVALTFHVLGARRADQIEKEGARELSERWGDVKLEDRVSRF
jgi:hypothetical protein